MIALPKVQKALIAAFITLITLTSVPVECFAAAVRVVSAPIGPTKPSKLRTVLTETTPCSGGFSGARRIDSRLTPKGNRTTFSIPAGYVFVITNVDFHLTSSGASRNIKMRLGVPCGSGCMKPIFDAFVLTDASGIGGANVSIGNGIAIRPGVEMCVADVNFSSVNAFATVHGYLAKDE